MKDSFSITEVLLNKIILDLNVDEDNGDLEPSEYLLFVKDTHYENDENHNNLSLVIICYGNGYVVNNGLRFNSMSVKDKELIFYYMANNKRKEIKYYLK